MRVSYPPSSRTGGTTVGRQCSYISLPKIILTCGYRTVVVHQPSKLRMRVRFPLPAPAFASYAIMQVTMNIRWSSITIFILFFGVSLLEAIQSKNWIMAGLWLLIGFVFLLGDILNQRRK